MIEWLLDRLSPATIVCRSSHVELMEKYSHSIVIDNSLQGPAHAVHAAIRAVHGPVTVAFADTFFDEPVPDGDSWCAVGKQSGPQVLDVVIHDRVFRIAVPEGATDLVCAGLFRFPSAVRLRLRLRETAHIGAGLGPCVNTFESRFVDLPTWRDVGTPEALATAAEVRDDAA